MADDVLCSKCPEKATWNFNTQTKADMAGMGLRPFCGLHAAETHLMIENVYRDKPKERENLLSRLEPLEVS